MNPLVKKALAAVAAKEIWDRVQEARQPKKPSFGARLFKLTLIGGVIGGAFYAYKSGLFNNLLGRSSDDDYRSSMSYQGPSDYASSSYSGSTDLGGGQASSEGQLGSEGGTGGEQSARPEGERSDQVSTPTT